MTRDLQSSITANIGCASFDEDKSRKVLRVNPKLTQQSLTGRRLCGSEPNHVVTLMGKNKLDSASAQIAYSVKHDDMSRVHRRLPGLRGRIHFARKSFPVAEYEPMNFLQTHP
jgi:hypothetical protein